MCVTESHAWMSSSEPEAFGFNIIHSPVWPRSLKSLCRLSDHSILQIQWEYWVVRQSISMHRPSFFV